MLFKNRYMVFEALIDTKDSSGNDMIILTEGNLSKAIRDSILLNFGECGLAISLGSFQGSDNNNTKNKISCLKKR